MKSSRWSFLRELVPLVLVLLAADHYLFAGRLPTFEPSSLWLLILLVAPRYGSIAGIVSGLTASVIYLWWVSGQGYLWQDILHRQPIHLIMPGLFLLCGLYLGTISERQLNRVIFIRKKLGEANEQLRASETSRAALERSRVDMEKRIAGQTATLLTLQGSFRKLDAAHSEEELFFALEGIMLEESQAESCAIWQIEKGSAKLVGGTSAGEVPPIAMHISRYRKVLTATDANLPTPGADLAALVRERDGQRLVITFAGIPFARLTRNLALRTGLQADQAGLVLGTIQDRAKLRSLAALDQESGLVSETYLRRRLGEEVALARRHKTSLALLACSISTALPDIQERLETALACSIRAAIRFSDGFSWFPNEKCFIIVLPQCDETGARIVEKKINAIFAMLNLKDGSGRDLYRIRWHLHIAEGDRDGDESLTRLLSNECMEVAA